MAATHSEQRRSPPSRRQRWEPEASLGVRSSKRGQCSSEDAETEAVWSSSSSSARRNGGKQLLQVGTESRLSTGLGLQGEALLVEAVFSLMFSHLSRAQRRELGTETAPGLCRHLPWSAKCPVAALMTTDDTPTWVSHNVSHRATRAKALSYDQMIQCYSHGCLDTLTRWH